MLAKSFILVTILSAVFAEDVAVNRGNVALTEAHHRAVRSPQQNNFPGFPNMPPPGFDASHIVSQNTDVNKNGFAQTTIYKSENGMGSSSTSYSTSQAASLYSSYCMTVIILLTVNLSRQIFG